MLDASRFFVHMLLVHLWIPYLVGVITKRHVMTERSYSILISQSIFFSWSKHKSPFQADMFVWNILFLLPVCKHVFAWNHATSNNRFQTTEKKKKKKMFTMLWIISHIKWLWAKEKQKPDGIKRFHYVRLQNEFFTHVWCTGVFASY